MHRDQVGYAYLLPRHFSEARLSQSPSRDFFGCGLGASGAKDFSILQRAKFTSGLLPSSRGYEAIVRRPIRRVSLHVHVNHCLSSMRLVQIRVCLKA